MTRLRRTVSRAGQIAGALIAGAILGTLSFFVLRYADETLFRVIGGGFGLVAVLCLLGAIHRTLALVTPETIVEMEPEAFYLGKRSTLTVRQPGNASFESLRVNLVGEEQTRRKKNNWNRRVFETINIFDSGPFDGELARTIDFDVPTHLEPTNSELYRRVRWTVEVWGRVKGRADFQHTYRVAVLPHDQADDGHDQREHRQADRGQRKKAPARVLRR